jgi:hypothetical protein
MEQISECIERLNANPVIQNRIFIDELLKAELARQASPTTTITISTTTTSTTSTTTSTDKAGGVTSKSEGMETVQDLGSESAEVTTTEAPTTPKVYQMPEFLVIVIQIHSRLNYLRELVDSLRDVKYIGQSLVIFSHDVWDDDMNEFIRSIDFCAVLFHFYFFIFNSFVNNFNSTFVRFRLRLCKSSIHIRFNSTRTNFPVKTQTTVLKRSKNPSKYTIIFLLVLALGQTRSDRFLVIRRLILIIFGYLILNSN